MLLHTPARGRPARRPAIVPTYHRRWRAASAVVSALVTVSAQEKSTAIWRAVWSASREPGSRGSLPNDGDGGDYAAEGHQTQ
ncbi:hypothetical protein PG985_015608 [Apiospora marii]|uniref:uncharacterized protein n=1 Tax=Apiospora marii TaxID=335849 RepID=UPI003130061D